MSVPPTPPEPANQLPPSQEPPSQQTGGSDISAADFQALRQQLADSQKRAAELEKAEQDRKDSALSETEKAKKEATTATERATQAEAKLRDQAINHAFQLAASQASCHDTDLAWHALDKSGLTYDAETGKVVGIDRALKALQASKPILFGPPPASGGVGNSGTSPVQGDITPDQIRSMSTEDFAKLQIAVATGKVKL